MDIPDEQIRDYTPAFKTGGQLCLATLQEDGSVKHEVLLEKPKGTICYPNLSWDARTIVFSMRDNFESDSYYLYTMDMATRRVTQITFPLKKDDKVLPVADCEPTFLPDGRIVFTSTRDVHISDCWYRAGGEHLSLRWGRRQHSASDLRPAHDEQPAGIGGWPGRVHPLGVQRPERVVQPSADCDESGRHGPDGVLRKQQHVSGGDHSRAGYSGIVESDRPDCRAPLDLQGEARADRSLWEEFRRGMVSNL